MTPDDYKKWLAGSTSGMSLAQNGERLFASLSCNACHNGRPDARGPSLANVYGSKLTHGQRLDDPRRRSVSARGNPESFASTSPRAIAPIMPTYQGQISEDGVISLVEYIKNLNSNYRVQQTTQHHQSAARKRRQGGNVAQRPAAPAGNPDSTGDGEAMSTTIVSLPDQSTARMPKMNFWPRKMVC